MNDLNSFFQILLSASMWSLDRIQRPAWTTALTLPAAFVAGILAGCFIWWGSKKSRRQKEVEERLRAALAMDTAKTPASTSAATSSTLHVPEVGKSPMAGSSALAIPEMTMSGKSPFSDPGTADTTPTLRPFGTPPKTKDLAEDSGTSQKGKGVERHWYEVNDAHDVGMQWDAMRRRDLPPTPMHAQRFSTASVPISDTMTVPPADMIYPPSVPRR